MRILAMETSSDLLTRDESLVRSYIFYIINNIQQVTAHKQHTQTFCFALNPYKAMAKRILENLDDTAESINPTLRVDNSDIPSWEMRSLLEIWRLSLSHERVLLFLLLQSFCNIC